MRAYELVELSALIAVNGQAFIHGGGRLPDSCIAQYWSVSRGRLDRWARALKRNLKQLQSGEEDLAAIACAHDRQAGVSYVSPVVRSVFLGHLEAHNRALQFLFYVQDHDPAEVLEINQIRRWSERWTDLLLAYLVPVCEVAQVACDPKRVADFAEDAGDQLRLAQQEQIWHLLRLALRSTFAHRLAKRSPNADLNAQIASSILACLRGDRFDASGTLDSLWMQRLEATAADAEAMIDELLAEEALVNEH